MISSDITQSDHISASVLFATRFSLVLFMTRIAFSSSRESVGGAGIIGAEAIGAGIIGICVSIQRTGSEMLQLDCGRQGTGTVVTAAEINKAALAAKPKRTLVEPDKKAAIAAKRVAKRTLVETNKAAIAAMRVAKRTLIEINNECKKCSLPALAGNYYDH